MPVGPISIICIKRTLAHGLRAGLLVGFVASFVEAIYGFIAAEGISIILEFLLSKITWIKFFGGILLIYIAYVEAKADISSNNPTQIKSKKEWRILTEVFFISLANPVMILTLLAIFASIDTTSMLVANNTLLMGLGIFIGAMLWSTILCGFVAKIKHRLSDTWLKRIKLASCIILAAFGLYSVLDSML